MPRRTTISVVSLTLAALVAAWPTGAVAGVTLTRYPAPDVSFDKPVNLAAPPGDDRRLFVVERAGRVRLVKDGALLAAPFLDLSAEVDAFPADPANKVFSENGMASIAFAPDYATSGKLYAFFTDASLCDAGTHRCDDRLVELRRSPSDPDVADPTERTLLTVPHRASAIHHGGQLAFGPDGRLWLTTGDGGPYEPAQDPASLSGKILRLDPDDATPQAEIVALGLRNPYRFSFDPATGDLVLGDVGEFVREEIDALGAGVTGANFGWAVCEGTVAHQSGNPPCPPDPVPNYVPPITDYPRGAGCAAVTGGLVARDGALPELYGRYLYGDYCKGFVHSGRLAPGRLDDPADVGVSVPAVTAFGQDARCAVYAVSNAGPVYRFDSGVAHTCAAPRASGDPDAPAPGGELLFGGAPRTPDIRSPDATPPRLRFVRLSRTRFAVGRPKGRHRPTRGAVLRFALSEPATLTVRLYRIALRAPHARLAGSLTRRYGKGAHALSFTGRLQGRALRPGRYRMRLRARDSAGNLSVARLLTLTVLGR